MTHENNDDFLRRIMTFGCPTGPLIQAFVFEALQRYSKVVAATPASDMDSAMLSGEAWKRTGQWLGEELAKRLGGTATPAPSPDTFVDTTFTGYVSIDGQRVQVDFMAPSGDSKENLDSAFLDALAQVAEVNYLALGDSPSQ